METNIVQNVLNLPDEEADVLFKPKQREVLRRTLRGTILNDNQKRYLRGDIRKKLDVIALLTKMERDDELMNLLNGIENYYITGFAALKHNGFGWYFDPKRIVVINTRIEGTFHIPGKIVKLIRLKSLKNMSFISNKKTNIKYATNEQILKDAKNQEDEALIKECMAHLQRYGNLFIDNSERYKREELEIRYDPEDFGV